MKTCRKCGYENDNVNFCSACGNDLRIQNVQCDCPHCGFHGNSENNIYCSKCGRRLKGRGFGKNLLIALVAIGLLLVPVAMYWLNSIDSCMDDRIENYVEPQALADTELQESMNPTNTAQREVVIDEQDESVSMITIDMNCDHIFEVFNGKNGIETSCRFCGASQVDLYNAGIELPNEPCECEYETVIQSNGTPAFECKKCHGIHIYPNPPLTELKLLSDTNARGKHDDIKYGTFYHNGLEWENAVRFWVADKSGYTNTESLEVYLANSYTELYAVTFAANESDDNTNMTLRFYGDGELIYEITDITKDSEEKDVRINVTDIEVLRVECSTEIDAFGYCILHGTAWY